jgi:iron only hydrogenase large subunit-like protein
MELLNLIHVDEENCVNCHLCVAACPVKFANNASGDVVKINKNLCIGCGQCLVACSHGARILIDDTDKAILDLKQKKTKFVAVVAPAIASNFPNTYLNFNGWLKSLGIEAIFDVSFGAELTVKSYLEYIKTNKPKIVIAQPCPAIVSFIEIYRPLLLQYLAPADSPMLHTIKMIKTFYTKYKNHKVIVISPCIAKKREFDETGLGDYNVTITNIIKHLDEKKIDLHDFPEIDFDNDPAERAVLFSSPGGLLKTAEREVPGISNKTRKIEGVNSIYKYIKHLEESIKKGTNPLLIDCLNCEFGCNGGTGTPNKEKLLDELEFLVEERKTEIQNKYKTTQEDKNAIQHLQKIINKYWKPGLYDRTYINHSDNYKQLVKLPDKTQLNEIYHSMHKYKDEDIKNCSSCGYNSCEVMAKSIFDGFNKKENCHFFLSFELNGLNKDLDLIVQNKTEELEKINQKANQQKNEIIHNSEELLEIIAKVQKLIK